MEEQLLEQCKREETELQFHSFSHNDALKLGLDLLKASEEYPGILGIEIRINHVTVFKYLPDGTGAYHDMWLRRTSNLVDVREMSTLRAFAELAVLKEDLQKDWLLDPAEYAACGGGFPIRIQDSSVIGSICVSGLPHLQDHAVLIAGIRRFLASPSVAGRGRCQD